MGVVGVYRDFRTSSVRDLLDARDQYHWHLMNKPNVVGTAIGLYLIRHDDEWPSETHPHAPQQRPGDKLPRTLANSETRPYSWPCVLVFVDQWVRESQFSGSPTDMVPKTLYLRDGRTIPVCVVLVEPDAPAPVTIRPTAWPSLVGGGGTQLVVDSQQLRREASAGCLVTDGHTIYVLTNRHVCGEQGQRISARTRFGVIEIGTSSDRQLTKRPFQEVYPTFPGSATYLNLDVGLVEVDDANAWSASTYGLGPTDALADLNEGNIGTHLIDRSVRSYGAASGLLQATVKGLFYRYQSIAGIELVADFLLAPHGPSTTQPGDSGSVWFLEVPHNDEAPRLHPVAVEWGAQTFDSAGRSFNFALATTLSNVCRLLDVEVVVSHNLAARPFWGAAGHYSVADIALRTLPPGALATLMSNNAEAISFDRATLILGDINELVHQGGLVPLADVPDIIWKKTPKTTVGGRDIAPNVGPEHPTHYCDIDEPNDAGLTLRELCIADPTKVEVAFWQQFYDAAGHTESASRGCLPFRVWQFFDTMVDCRSRGDILGFLCAAGLVAHYVGDACQPLHGSVLADGFKDQATQHTTPSGHVVTDWPGKGVHSAYETKMVDRHAPDLFDKVDLALAGPAPQPLAPIHNGQQAAVAVVALMDRTAKALPPRTLINRYIELGEGTSRRVLDRLWDTFADATTTIMIDGALLLGHLWNSAWTATGQPDPAPALLKKRPSAEIIGKYTDTTFVPSLDLNNIATVLS